MRLRVELVHGPNMVQSCPIHRHLDTSLTPLTPLTPRNLKNKQLRLAPRPTEANGAAGWLKDAWKFSNFTGNHYDRPLMSNHIIQSISDSLNILLGLIFECRSSLVSVQFCVHNVCSSMSLLPLALLATITALLAQIDCMDPPQNCKSISVQFAILAPYAYGAYDI